MNYLMRESEYFPALSRRNLVLHWSHEHEPRFTCSVESDTPAVAAEHVPWPGS